MSSKNGRETPWKGRNPTPPGTNPNNSILNSNHCDPCNTTTQNKMLQSIDSIVQFADGEKAKWNNVDIPIPKGMVIIATDTLEVKIGNGEDIYKDLPVLFSFRTILDLMDKVNELAEQIAITNQSVDNGDVSGDTFQFSLKDGNKHLVRFTSNNVKILEPILPEGADSGDAVCIVTCGTNDTRITFGSNIRFLGREGKILLNGQTYMYKFTTIETKTYIESFLVPNVIT